MLQRTVICFFLESLIFLEFSRIDKGKSTENFWSAVVGIRAYKIGMCMCPASFGMWTPKLPIGLEYEKIIAILLRKRCKKQRFIILNHGGRRRGGGDGGGAMETEFWETLPECSEFYHRRYSKIILG